MIIIEGMDGTGKSTVASNISKMGYNVHHLQYSEKNEKGFLDLLKLDDGKLVLDRGFITELVYGPILRNYSRISEEETNNLIKNYSAKNSKIIYLKTLKSDLLKRRKDDLEDFEMLSKYYEVLNSKYDEIMKYLSNYFKILTINTSIENIAETNMLIKKFLMEK